MRIYYALIVIYVHFVSNISHCDKNIIHKKASMRYIRGYIVCFLIILFKNIRVFSRKLQKRANLNEHKNIILAIINQADILIDFRW